MAEQNVALREMAKQENSTLNKEQTLKHWILLAYWALRFAQATLKDAEHLNEQQRCAVVDNLFLVSIIMDNHIMKNLSHKEAEESGIYAYTGIKWAYNFKHALMGYYELGEEHLKNPGVIDFAESMLEQSLDAFGHVARDASNEKLRGLAQFYTVPEIR